VAAESTEDGNILTGKTIINELQFTNSSAASKEENM